MNDLESMIREQLDILYFAQVDHVIWCGIRVTEWDKCSKRDKHEQEGKEFHEHMETMR